MTRASILLLVAASALLASGCGPQPSLTVAIEGLFVADGTTANKIVAT